MVTSPTCFVVYPVKKRPGQIGPNFCNILFDIIFPNQNVNSLCILQEDLFRILYKTMEHKNNYRVKTV